MNVHQILGNGQWEHFSEKGVFKNCFPKSRARISKLPEKDMDKKSEQHRPAVGLYEAAAGCCGNTWKKRKTAAAALYGKNNCCIFVCSC